MNEAAVVRSFPRGPLLGATALVGFSLMAAAFCRVVGTPSLVPDSAPVIERSFRFVDRADGGVGVYDDRDGTLAAVIAPGQDNFMRATLRGLASQRKRSDLGAEAPFNLTAWADGRLTLEDTATQRHIELEAFGETNEASFARLLNARGPAR